MGDIVSTITACWKSHIQLNQTALCPAQSRGGGGGGAHLN